MEKLIWIALNGGSIAGVTVSEACAELPLYDAVIVAVWFELTLPAVIVNVAGVEPAGTVTVAGTDAAL